MRYNNYHKHDHKGNVCSLDVIVKFEDYCKRAVELGHDIVFTTNHGMQGDLFEAYSLCEEYNLKMVVGAECYYVNDRLEKDRSNKHIIIICMNNEGVKELNNIISQANIDGFYYKPRIDHELLFSLTPDNFVITTACVAGIWNDESLIKELKDYFGNNFFLEVQNHNVSCQKEVNKKVLNLSNKLNIRIIHANDSHYINPEDSAYRDLFLKAKGIHYESEDEFILDYPDDKTIIKRYEEQGILNKNQIKEALNSTLIFDNVEKFNIINYDIKLPSVSKDPNKELQSIINDKWVEERKNIDKKQWGEYLKAIRYEFDIIKKTNMANYFLIDYKMAKIAKEKYGGVLTHTGRGCFMGDVLVHTEESLKKIKDIQIGERVITKDGKLNRILNKFEYDINEEMIKIEHLCGKNENYPAICTKDHKILINRNGENSWIEAQDILKSDYVCAPNKIKLELKSEKILKDNNYYYFPITKIEHLPRMKAKVYDLMVENNHNYLINNMIVHNSAPSFFTTKLLELTDINRLKSPITLFPTRFMSTERILGARSLPDIDLNTADSEPFIQATKDLLGEKNCSWMISWKPLQTASAFRLYCKAMGKDINEYNDIAKDLDKYIDDDYWKPIINDSSKFVGVVEGISESPCSMCLYDKDISREIGLIKTPNGKICCLLDGYNCDKYKYLKNDYLTVMVWAIIRDTCKLSNIEIPTIEELNSLLDEKTFDIYKKGLTCSINQADSNYATGLVKRYKPKSLAEMSAFVAIIRPGCASLLNDFIDRKEYTTGIKELDAVLEDSDHRLIYQESIMKYLIWLGISESQSYDIIKKIAKKKFKEAELKVLKEQLLEGWNKQVGSNDGFEETWQVVEDASRYSFNASHSLSYAYDSLYGAYLKSHYPLEYYTTALNYYKGDMDRTNKLIDELKDFNIKLEKPVFRHSLFNYFMDKENMTIYKGVSSIKFLNESSATYLYSLKDNKYDSFVDLLYDIDDSKEINSRQLKILIQLQFFSEFGNNQKLLNIYDIFNKIANKKIISKSKIDDFGDYIDLIKKYSNKETEKQYSQLDNKSILKEIELNMPNENVPLKEQIDFEYEILGYINLTYKINKNICYVLDVDTKYSPKITLYSLGTGKEIIVKIQKNLYKDNPIKKNMIINALKFEEKYKSIKNGDRWEKTSEKEWWLSKYKMAKETDLVEKEGEK